MTAVPQTLLIGWDGADWNYLRPLMDRGLLPTLSHLVKHGVTADLVSLPPYISPMLWNSIATGKRPWRHGVHGFTEIGADNKVRPVTSCSRQVPALWNILTAEHRRALITGWYASHPAEPILGVTVAESFFKPPAKDGPLFPTRSVAPAALAADLADLRVTAESLDPGLIRLLCPNLTHEVASRDRRVQTLAERLAEAYSIHNVHTSLLETEPWDFAAVYFHFLDWVMHDFEPFLPPAKPGLPRAEVERFGGVAEGACRLQDLLLAETLRVVGPHTRIFLVSDHGYLTGKIRLTHTPSVPAGIAAHHRPVGIFLACGPGLRRGEHLGTASLLDLTPTLLHALDLPVGADMDGRPLTEIFEHPRAPKFIKSWDTRAPLPARDLPDVADPAEEASLLERFADLGYVDPASLKDPNAAHEQRLFNGWNKGMDLLDAGLAHDALPLLEQASWNNPEIHTYAYWLARCQARLGLAELAEETCDALRDYGDQNLQNRVFLAIVALESNRPREVLRHLDVVLKLRPAGLHVQSYRALALLALGQWREAFELLFAEAAERPSAEVWLGIARCYLHRGQLADAEAAARHALTYNPRLAPAHLCLARALARQEKLPAAWLSLCEAHRLAPHLTLVRQVAGRFFPGRVQELLAPPAGTRPPDKKSLLAESRARRAAWDAALAARRAGQSPINIFPEPPPPGSSGQTFVIVSGLPRSGTSLLMQMLDLGGLPPMTDHHRAPDAHNPRGFFEWEKIKLLPKQPNLIEQTAGKAVKIISALTAHLPREHLYKFIVATRHPAEIAASQEKMLSSAQVASPRPDLSLSKVAAQLARHQDQWLQALRAAKNATVLEVPYAAAIADPAVAAAQIAAFLGPDLLPHPDRMPAAIDPSLYRNKSKLDTKS